MADLGDLGEFLKEGGISNLDWLEVDPAEYRATSVLPRQNLDVVPDLEALWSHEDKPASAYVQNKGSLPHTMGDLSEEHGNLRAKPEDIRKTARLALMQSDDLRRLKDVLAKRFDRDSLRDSRDIVAGVLAERGLLGRFYINAADFEGCDTGASQPIEFVRRYAADAKFVLAKDKCAGCIHAMQSMTGGDTCAVFHKEIKVQVPYTEELAEQVEQMQRSQGKAVVASSAAPKERIRLALLAPNVMPEGPAAMPKPVDDVARLMRPIEAHEDYVRPLDLTPLREEARAAVKTALATGKITVQAAQQAYRLVAEAQEAHPINVILATSKGLPIPEAPAYQGAGKGLADQEVQRQLRPVESHEAYAKPLDLTPLQKEAKKAVNTALSLGRITVEQAQTAFKIVASATDTHALEVIKAKALGLPAPQRASYGGVGIQPKVAEVAPEVAHQQLISVASLTKKRDEEARRVVAAEKARPIVELMRREMLKGRNATEIRHALRHSFQESDLQQAKEFMTPLASEVGLYGVIYSTQDTFPDCREGADFFATYNPGVRGIVAGQKCDGCIYNKMARCLMYGKPLVKNASELYTQEVIDQVAQNYRSAGLQVKTFGNSPKMVLAKMHDSARQQIIQGQRSPVARLSQSVSTAYQMNYSNTLARTSALTRREIVKTAQRFLNEGLYGPDLLSSLKSRFEVRDIKAASLDLKPVLVEQGLQGIHYIDPTIYEDYGKGCKEASALHRSRLVPYVKLGSKCGSCIHQNRQGFCSVINKPLVVEPPYVDKAAQQREVLASGKSTEIAYESLMNNGLTMMAEYQLQNGGLDVEVDAALEPEVMGIEFGGAGQGVKL